MMYKAPKRDKKLGFGKRMGDNLYFFFDYAEEVLGKIKFSKAKKIAKQVYEKRWGKMPIDGVDTPVLKWNEKKQQLSFIFCDEFFETPEPAIGGYITVNLNTESGISRMYFEDFPIYHHKWLMVKENFKDFVLFNCEDLEKRSELIEKLLNSDLFNIDKKRIGMYTYWKETVVPVLNRMKEWRDIVESKPCKTAIEAMALMYG